MARTAIFVDLAFFIWRYRRVKLRAGEPLEATAVADSLRSTARSHLQTNDQLHRILVYDCPPLSKRAHNPISGKAIDFSRTELFRFRTLLHQQLLRTRKVALRLGELSSAGQWTFRETVTKALLNGSLNTAQLKENDVEYNVRQKGVDLKMGIDIASVAYKHLADRIILITGDADFVPAAKLARREGIDVILDPLWATVPSGLNEHIDGLRTRWEKPAKDHSDA